MIQDYSMNASFIITSVETTIIVIEYIQQQFCTCPEWQIIAL